MAIQTSARAVQDGLFKALGQDQVLGKLFSPHSGSAPQRPSLSFDDMSTSPYLEEANLLEHRLRISLWAEAHDVTTATKLAQAFETLIGSLSLKSYRVVRRRLRTISSTMDWQARSWRVRLEVQLLTQTTT